MKQITLLGPLSIQLDLRVKDAATLVGDAHLARHKSILFGGPLLRIARLLRSIGNSPNLCAYLGNDDFGNQIIDTIKNEGIDANIQKIPNINTPILCKLHDKQDYSYYITETNDLTLWKFRLQSIEDGGIIYIDPSIPSQVHLEIIKQFKNSTIIVRKPLDKKLDIYESTKKLIVLFNEYEVFQIFADFSKGYFYPEKILTLDLFENHTVLIESKDFLATKNETDTIVNINLDKIRHNYAMMDEHFLTGIFAGFSANQPYMNSFLWGLICSMQNGRNQPIQKLDIVSKSEHFAWIESNTDKREIKQDIQEDAQQVNTVNTQTTYLPA